MTESDAPAVESPTDGRQIKDRVVLTLPCALSRNDWIERCKHLANLLTQVDAMEDDHAAQKLAMKDERERLGSEIRATRRIVASGEEEREVECVDFYDFDKGVVDRVRVDTTETISTRAMTAEERQPSLL